MALNLTKKIKNEYGTIQRFCDKNNINYNTYKGVANGSQTSLNIVKILKKHKYISNADDLKKVA